VLVRRNKAAIRTLLMAAAVAIAIPPAIGSAEADDKSHAGRPTSASDTVKNDGSMWYSIPKIAVLAVVHSLCRETTGEGVVILRGTPCVSATQ
jgi:hypothetical protein